MQDDLITPPMLILNAEAASFGTSASSHGYTVSACFVDHIKDYKENQGICPECGKLKCVIFENSVKRLEQGMDEKKLLTLGGPTFIKVAKENYDSFEKFSKILIKNYEILGNTIDKNFISKMYRDDISINKKITTPTPQIPSQYRSPSEVNSINNIGNELRMCLHALNDDSSQKGLRSNPDIVEHCKNKRFDLAAQAFSKNMDLSDRDQQIFDTFYAKQSRLGQIAIDVQETKSSLQYISTATEVSFKAFGKRFNDLSIALRSNFRNANAVPFDQAMEMLAKLQSYPHMKIAPEDIETIRKAVHTIDYQDIGDSMQKMSKGFGYAGKALQIESIYDKILIGIETNNWKPLLLEFESMAAGAAAAFAIAFAYKLALGTFAVSGVGTVALVVSYLVAAAFFTPERMDKINNMIFN
ncbi:colicin-like pore-forming protein [Chromobacterium sp. LK1]|uniref:colicin-like pore-forming protein n=1 Tax=Chromobacterium sp. LK1 TaxID=1628193 RepID=UPI0009E20027|nr:colicin-like pore-forming protein [Chromobacterium sp. LK1]